MQTPDLTREQIYYQGQDVYGRRTYFNYSRHGVIVTLPKGTAHLRPEGENYMVNLREPHPAESTIQFFRTLREAKDYYIANAIAR